MHKEKSAACRPGLLVICKAIVKDETAETGRNSSLQVRGILCDTRSNQGRCTCNTQNQGQQYHYRKCSQRWPEAVALRTGWSYVDGGIRGDHCNATRLIRPARDRDYLVKRGTQLASALEAVIRCFGKGFSNYIVNAWR